MDGGELIALRDVYRTYRIGDTQVRALNGVSLVIRRGEYVAIMGPSGSGKSSCMNLIGCLDHPTAGEIRIGGVDTARMEEKALAELRNRVVGFVFQQYHLIPTMSILENVMLPLRYQGVALRERRERAEEILGRVGLGERLRHRPHQLSGGQKQRTAIARAMVTRPALLLADEPTGALDSETGASVLSLFEDIHRGGTTVVVVTHDPGIGSRAKRRIHIRDGKIVEDQVGGSS
jgi:putative ABC transport system ATP-binding protein